LELVGPNLNPIPSPVLVSVFSWYPLRNDQQFLNVIKPLSPKRSKPSSELYHALQPLSVMFVEVLSYLDMVKPF
jgi:hypothetical protein